MNKVMIISEERGGSVYLQVGDIVETVLGTVYIKTPEGYVNLSDGYYATDEQFNGRILKVIREARIKIYE